MRAAPKTKKNFSQLEKLLKTEEEQSKAGKPATVMQSKAPEPGQVRNSVHQTARRRAGRDREEQNPQRGG